MRKPSKTSLTRKLDTECSRIVRSRGSCQWCGLEDYEKLQCAHIYSRTYKSVRFDMLNLLCLCGGCHFRWHKKPLESSEWVRNTLGEYYYQMLKTRANSIKRWTISEMQDLLASLKVINI